MMRAGGEPLQCWNNASTVAWRVEPGWRSARSPPGTDTIPAAQIRLSNHVFQGISVVKDPDHVAEDIYFQAQMVSLSRSSRTETSL